MIHYFKNQYTAYKNHGFTLIELIVVMAIIAVLVLLATPKFVGQIEKTKIVQIRNDVMVAEMKVSEAGSDVWYSWTDHGVISSGTLEEFIREDGKFYGRGGPLIESEVEDGGYRVLPRTFIEQEIRSRLEGTFYANKNGRVYYESGVARQGDTDKKEPGYSDEKIDDLVYNHNYIPVATADELNSTRNNTPRIYGEGTKWKGTYTGGLDKKYIQVANIDLSGYGGWISIGTSSSSFTGTYDGGNYVITRLEVNGESYQGLFGRTDGATIRNVGLIDNKVTGHEYVGGLVGLATSRTTISNSYATGEVTGSENKVGGLVGYSGGSMVENSYATGIVTGEGDVGGLVGYAGGSTIKNSYATGEVTARGSAGGLVGRVEFSTISNSYWDRETTGQTTSSWGTGKTTYDMMKEDTYEGWNFETIWKIDEGNDYPRLR